MLTDMIGCLVEQANSSDNVQCATTTEQLGLLPVFFKRLIFSVLVFLRLLLCFPSPFSFRFILIAQHEQ